MHGPAAPTTSIIHREHEHVLRLLRDAGDRPVSLGALRDAGIERPAAVLYELELQGHAISRAASLPGGRSARVRLHEASAGEAQT